MCSQSKVHNNLIRKFIINSAVWAGLAALMLTPVRTLADVPAYLQNAVDSPYRSAENRQRDQYRHPVQTLQFFGLKPDMQVLEIWPARGWYSEILAPVLKEQGQLTLAVFKQNDGTLEDERKIFWARLASRLDQDIRKNPGHFGKVEQFQFDPPGLMIGQVNRFDMILSFRNSHIWNEEGYLLDVFRNFFDALKPGGVLGLVEHRAARLSEITSRAGEGYLDEYYVISVAKQAGFVLAERSEINANPLDSKNHPRGVYTLPPTLAMGQQDRAKYLAIGESDRMTLRFVKPATAVINQQ
jgi:predicted methyltransferase